MPSEKVACFPSRLTIICISLAFSSIDVYVLLYSSPKLSQAKLFRSRSKDSLLKMQ